MKEQLNNFLDSFTIGGGFRTILLKVVIFLAGWLLAKALKINYHQTVEKKTNGTSA